MDADDDKAMEKDLKAFRSHVQHDDHTEIERRRNKEHAIRIFYVKKDDLKILQGGNILKSIFVSMKNSLHIPSQNLCVDHKQGGCSETQFQGVFKCVSN